MILVGKSLDIVGASYCVASRAGQWQKAAINKQMYLGKVSNAYVFLCWLQTQAENYKGNRYTKKRRRSCTKWWLKFYLLALQRLSSCFDAAFVF